MSEEEFWRNKIANDLSSAWEKMTLKQLYSGELLISIILDFIKDGSRETLQ